METPQRLAEYFKAHGGVEFKPAFNIAPSSRIVTITADQANDRHMNLMCWGLIPSWAKDPSIGNKLVNARGETVSEKPSFRSAFRVRRCLIPATGFYEWKTVSGRKYPFFISYKSGEPLAMAGIWETWQAAGEQPIETCCVITTQPNSVMEPIHDRMPVLLDEGQWETWLSPNVRNPADVLPMIKPHDADGMQAWPVSRELNRVGQHDDEGLMAEIGKGLFDE